MRETFCKNLATLLVKYSQWLSVHSAVNISFFYRDKVNEYKLDSLKE